MRHATRFLFATALALAASRAGAQVPDTSGSLSDELLRLWNKDYSVEADAALDESSWDGHEIDDSGSMPLGSGTQRPGGGSLTPNLDRLLGNGMEAAPDPSFPSPKDSPYGFAPSSGASKGSNDPTINTGRSRCGERGHRHDRRCRPEPPRCGERGHRHDHRCHVRPPRCGERGHRHDHRCHPRPPRCDPPNTPPTPTPEPASMLLLGLGAGAAAGARVIRNRRTKKQ